MPRAWGPPARLSLGHKGQRSHSALGFYDVYFPRSESRAGWGDCPSLRAAPGRSQTPAGGRLEEVGHPAEGLDARALGLPVGEAAEVAPLHQVHAAAVVGLLVQDPPRPEGGGGQGPVLSSAGPGRSCPGTTAARALLPRSRRPAPLRPGPALPARDPIPVLGLFLRPPPARPFTAPCVRASAR